MSAPEIIDGIKYEVTKSGRCFVYLHFEHGEALCISKDGVKGLLENQVDMHDSDKQRLEECVERLEAIEKAMEPWKKEET